MGSKNHALRQFILEFLAKNGGRATIKEIRQALSDASIVCHATSLNHYLQGMVAEESLVNIGKSVYALPESMEDSSDRIFLRIPFGTQLFGRVLHYMLHHRFVRAADVYQALKAAGHTTNRTSVYTALYKLRKLGYVRAVAHGMYMLTNKTLRAIGLTDVLDAPRKFDGPIGLIIRPHVLELLGACGALRPREVTRHLKIRGFAVKSWHAPQALRQLEGHQRVTALDDGRFALTKAEIRPAAFTPSASTVTTAS